MTKNVFILNGPNLNRLGTREPDIYGYETLQSVEERCAEKARSLDFELDFRQTNFEGTLIESVHEAIEKDVAGIIINPAGLTFTSMSLMDALKMFEGLKVEVHISNIHQREELYHNSLISCTATAVMAGFGTDGYLLALQWLRDRIHAG